MLIIDSFGKNVLIGDDIVGYIDDNAIFIHGKKFAEISDDGKITYLDKQIGYVDDDGSIIIHGKEAGYIDFDNNFVFYRGSLSTPIKNTSSSN